jgi:hypothetical protein
MSRRRARAGTPPRKGRAGGWQGWGDLLRDAISGWTWPEELMVKQCGGYRRVGPQRGTHDLCDPTDDCCPAKPGATVVSVTATDDAASEDGGTGTFTISRTGSTESALLVYFAIGGTADLDTDYTASATSPVTIPAGSSSVTVTITPLEDAVTDVDETVILSIVPHPNLSYDILASAYQDTVTITDVEPVEDDPILALPSILFWHKADAMEGYGDGDPMAAGWVDSSGNGFTAEAPSLEDPPTYETNVQKGLPVARVAAVDTYLRYPGLTIDEAGTSLTLHAAFNYTTGQSGYGILIEFYQNVGDGGALYVDNNGQVGFNTEVGGDVDLAGAVSGWQILTWVLDGDAGTSTLYRDGNEIGSDTFDAGGVEFGPDQINWFSFQGGSNFLQGDYGELIGYAAAHTPEQVATVTDYLTEKWLTVEEN